MTENEAIEVIITEKKCVLRNIQGCDRNCGRCDLVMKDKVIIAGYNVAISALEEIQQYRAIGTVEKCNIFKGIAEKIFSAACLDMKIIDELHEYKNIGTIQECREAMEKQKAKQPDIWGDGYSEGKLVYDMYDCPNCGKSYEIDSDDYDYCPNCGQKLYRRRQYMDCIDCEHKNDCGEPSKSRDCDPAAGVKDNRNQNTQ